MNSDSKVLITGGLGFVGSNLARHLIRNEILDITILSRSKSKIRNIQGIEDQIDLVIDDVKNVASYLGDFDYIFHLASTTDNYAIQNGEPHRDSEVNVLASSYLLDAIRRMNSDAKLVFCSTFFVVGNPESCPVDESVCCRPRSIYGATRLCGEHLTYAYRKAFELNATVVRFTNLYGPYEISASSQKGVFNYFVVKALQDQEITVYGEGAVKRDYLYVNDAVRALTLVAQYGDDRLYFVGSGMPRKIRTVFEKIVEVVGSGKIKTIETPEFHEKVGTMDFWVDNSKIQSLGWSKEFSLQEGIRATAEYYKANPELIASIGKEM